MVVSLVIGCSDWDSDRAAGYIASSFACSAVVAGREAGSTCRTDVFDSEKAKSKGVD